MSIATSSAGPISGATGSAKASVLWPQSVSLPVGDRQILVRVDRGGIHIGEGELHYQLERKDEHPLAQADELLDALADLEERGLLEAELCFRLTAQGRACLRDPRGDGGERFAVREDGVVVCVACVREAEREGAPVLVHAWIVPGPGVCCEWCGVSVDLDDDGSAGS
jgi:hypothetical protein